MTRPVCRWCHTADPAGELRQVRVGDIGLLGRSRQARPVFEHPSCLSRWAAAGYLAACIRDELNRAALEAIRTGRVDDAVALSDAALDILDSHYLDLVA